MVVVAAPAVVVVVPPAVVVVVPPAVVVVAPEAVVVVAPEAVVVVAPEDDDDVEPVDCGFAVLAVVDGFVVDAPWLVSLPPRSPGLAMVSAMPAPKITTAAINRRDARCFRIETSSSESG